MPAFTYKKGGKGKGGGKRRPNPFDKAGSHVMDKKGKKGK